MLMVSVHPGQHVMDELEAREISASELAEALQVPTERVEELLAEKVDLSAEMAWRLARWMGVEPAYWMRLDSHHRLVRAYDAARNEIEAVPAAPADAA